jgi:hypothetical protein
VLRLENAQLAAPPIDGGVPSTAFDVVIEASGDQSDGEE